MNDLSQTIDFSSAKEPGLCPEGVHLFKIDSAKFYYEGTRLERIALKFLAESENPEVNGQPLMVFFRTDNSIALWKLKKILMAYGMSEDDIGNYKFEERKIVEDLRDAYIGASIVHNKGKTGDSVGKTYANMKDIYSQDEFQSRVAAMGNQSPVGDNADLAKVGDVQPQKVAQPKKKVAPSQKKVLDLKIGQIVKINDPSVGEWVGKIQELALC